MPAAVRSRLVRGSCRRHIGGVRGTGRRRNRSFRGWVSQAESGPGQRLPENPGNCCQSAGSRRINEAGAARSCSTLTRMQTGVGGNLRGGSRASIRTRGVLSTPSRKSDHGTPSTPAQSRDTHNVPAIWTTGDGKWPGTTPIASGRMTGDSTWTRRDNPSNNSARIAGTRRQRRLSGKPGALAWRLGWGGESTAACSGPVRGTATCPRCGTNGTDRRSAEPPCSRRVDAFDGRTARTAGSILQHAGVLSRLDHHLRGTQQRLRRQVLEAMSGQSSRLPPSASASIMKGVGRAAAAEPCHGVQQRFLHPIGVPTLPNNRWTSSASGQGGRCSTGVRRTPEGADGGRRVGHHPDAAESGGYRFHSCQRNAGGVKSGGAASGSSWGPSSWSTPPTWSGFTAGSGCPPLRRPRS